MASLLSTDTNLTLTLYQECLQKLQERNYFDIIHLAVLIVFAVKVINILLQEGF